LVALTFRLGGASRRRGQRMSWSSPVKKVYFNPYFA
jgi:hypothetical protein